MPEKQYAQCRPFPSGRLLPSGVLTSCVETPQWECPGWWVTAAATAAHQPTNSTSAPDQRGLKLRSEQATKARLLKQAPGSKLRVPWAKTDMDDPYTRRCLVTLTRKWLETPSNLSRPWFETSFESNWPVYGHRSEVWPDACGPWLSRKNITYGHRCEKLQELDSSRHWVVLDSVPNLPKHSTPLTMCAPRWVTVACMSCHPSWLRPSIDTALPPPTFERRSGVYPTSHAEVFRRCLAPASVAASFQGRLNDPKRKAIIELNNSAVPSLGSIQIYATDATSRLLDNGTHAAFETLLRTSHFGFAPRGEARFSYRFSELAASAVLPITFDDWQLPFPQARVTAAPSPTLGPPRAHRYPVHHLSRPILPLCILHSLQAHAHHPCFPPQLIDWPSIGIILRSDPLDAGLEAREIRSVVEQLGKLSLSEVCRRRLLLFEAYHRYLKGPVQWEQALQDVVALHRRSA